VARDPGFMYSCRMANADEVFYELELAYRRRLPGRTADDLAAFAARHIRNWSRTPYGSF
jgi:hypothetical protein